MSPHASGFDLQAVIDNTAYTSLLVPPLLRFENNRTWHLNAQRHISTLMRARLSQYISLKNIRIKEEWLRPGKPSCPLTVAAPFLDIF